jgi:hypothetical protein
LLDYFDWELDKEGNIVVNWKIIIKWSDEYNLKMEKALSDVRLISWGLLRDAKKRKSNIIFKLQEKDISIKKEYKANLERLWNLYSIENLDNLFADDEKKWLLQVTLNDLNWWKFDDDFNIIIWNDLIKKWSEEYVNIINLIFKDITKVWKALIEYRYEEDNSILDKIIQNLWEDHPELKKEIESNSIKVFDIPWRDMIALSLNGDNVDYIYNLDWSEYFDFKWRRDNPVRYGAFMWATGIEEKIIDWENYIIVNGKEYKVFTKDYYDILIETLDEFFEFWRFFKEVADEMKKRWL